MRIANENSSLPTIKSLIPVLATCTLSAPCEGLDHDLDTPGEKLCLPTLHNKSLQSAIQNGIPAPITEDSLWLTKSNCPTFFKAEAGSQPHRRGASKGRAGHSSWSKLYERRWKDLSLPEVREDSGVPHETLIKKNHIFAVITEQEKVIISHKFMYSKVHFDRNERTAVWIITHTYRQKNTPVQQYDYRLKRYTHAHLILPLILTDKPLNP